jgi:ribosomal protein S18 acetylase RimI-like enzyme
VVSRLRDKYEDKCERGRMLRSATLSDLAMAASWITSARECELWAGSRVRFPIDLQSLPAAVQFTETNSFSLYANECLVAFGQLISKNSDRGQLARLIVAPAFRGKGYGETLVRELLAKAHAEGYHRVSLIVDRLNLPALALYSKLGFHDVPRPAEGPDSPGSLYMERPA